VYPVNRREEVEISMDDFAAHHSHRLICQPRWRDRLLSE
jgi:hypothetical protein